MAIGGRSILRLQQLLAELHYIPFEFETSAASLPIALGLDRSVAAPPATDGIRAEPTGDPAASASPTDGRLAWAYAHIPATLASEWGAGRRNLITRGAVMAFEADHGLVVDGIAGPRVWAALTRSVAAGQTDPRPYDYIEVSESEPERLTVWQDGNLHAFSSLANTGVTGAATRLGTFPVYLRYASQTMVGVDPDGTHYDDPDVRWIAYFNRGDALHGYPRVAYGFPQSNGCVELPVSAARSLFASGEDWYGTLVNIT